MNFQDRELCRSVSTMHGGLCVVIIILIQQMLKCSVSNLKDFIEKVSKSYNPVHTVCCISKINANLSFIYR